MARPVNRLVATRGRIVIHAAEGRSVRQLDMIEGRCEVGLVSAMANVGRDSREEGVDRRLPLGRDQRLLRFVRGVEIGWKTVDLNGVEHDVMAQEPDAPLHLLAGFGLLIKILERGIIKRKTIGRASCRERVSKYV